MVQMKEELENFIALIACELGGKLIGARILNNMISIEKLFTNKAWSRFNLNKSEQDEQINDEENSTWELAKQKD